MNVAQDIVVREYQPESFDELLGDLMKEVELRNYRVTRVNHIDNVFDQTERGFGSDVGFERYKIVEFCNLSSCVDLISPDFLAGVFMPVRFILYQVQGGTATFIAFLKPSAFARLFNSEAVNQVAALLEEDMHEVLEEVAF